MSEAIDLTGRKVNMLTVIRPAEHVKLKPKKWVCKCECGNYSEVITKDLNSGRVKSCGCIQPKIVKERQTTHGLRQHKLYDVFYAMRRRCNSEKSKDYKNYGGRGIKVCPEWNDASKFLAFYEWAISNGYVEGLSIDRIDNDGDYSPLNCRFVDNSTQCQNQRVDSTNNTGVSGVQYRKYFGDYRVVIADKGIRHHIGLYKSLGDATAARAEAERLYWSK